MKILAESFWIQKRGNLLKEYEDAACPRESRKYEQSCVRLAVADGATESVFAKRWAKQLVDAVGNDELLPSNLSEGVARLRAEWHKWLAGETIPWYAEEKARQGAFAALVALEFTAVESVRPPEEKRLAGWYWFDLSSWFCCRGLAGTAEESDGVQEGNWHAAAVGDSCLFHVRGENVLERFPLDNPEAFDNRPFLLSSVGADEKCLNEKNLKGTWKSGDNFYLMTDALACWFLKHLDAGSLADVQGDFPSTPETVDFPAVVPDTTVVVEGGFVSTTKTDRFRMWVESLRDKGMIRNDDCTLIRIKLL